MATAAELHADDVTELKQLLHKATRPRVQAFLSLQIGSLEKEAVSSQEEEEEEVEEEEAVEDSGVQYVALSDFSWEQDRKRVKIYLSLENVQEENVASKFDDSACEVKINNVNAKNYLFAIQKIHKPIDPRGCRVLIRPKKIIVSLKKLKEEITDWARLDFKEDKSEKESKKQPLATYLEIMKNMYDDGDDEIKKTISEGWTRFRSTPR